MKKLLYASICAWLFFFGAQTAFAQVASQVYISEINWAGSELSTADEWIELYNPNGAGVDIGGWVLTGAATSGNALSLEEGTVIDAEDVILISNYDLGHEKTTLMLQPDLVTSSLSLPNSHLEIMLTNPDGVVIDEVVTDSSPDYGSTDPKASMARDLISLEWMTSSEYENLTHNQAGTPGVAQSQTAEIIEDEMIEDIVKEQEIVETELHENTESNIEESETNQIIDDEIVDEEEIIVDDTPNIETEDEIAVEYESIETVIDEILENEDSSNEILDDESGDTEQIEKHNDVNEEVVVENNEVEIEVVEETVVETETVEEAMVEVTDDSEEVEAEPVIENSETVVDSETEGDLEIQPIRLSYETQRLIITEFVSNPEDGKEWVEIYNPGIDISDLSQWSVRDATSKETAFSQESIFSMSYAVLENPLGKLNNTGDTVELIDPQSNIIDYVTYGSSDIGNPGKGESLAWDGNAWTVTPILTPGAANQFPASETNKETYDNEESEQDSSEAQQIATTIVDTKKTETQSDHPNVSDANESVHKVVAIASSVENDTSSHASSSATDQKKEVDTSKVSVAGVITALPGTFGNQIAYINGYELYFHYPEWPALQIGDRVSVVGEFSESVSSRLKISSANDMKYIGSEVISATSIDAVDLQNMNIGSLITINGDIQSWDGSKLTIKDDSGSAQVIAHDNTGINWSRVSTSNVRITGIVRQTTNGLALYPRSQNDVQEITSEATIPVVSGSTLVSKKPNLLPWVGLALIVGVVGMLFIWKVRSQNLKLTPNHA